MPPPHHIDVIMTTMTSQITSFTVVYSTVYSDADQRKHQSSASLAFVSGIHRSHTKDQLRGKCFHLMTSSCLKLDEATMVLYWLAQVICWVPFIFTKCSRLSWHVLAVLQRLSCHDWDSVTVLRRGWHHNSIKLCCYSPTERLSMVGLAQKSNDAL